MNMPATVFRDLVAEAPVPARGILSQTLSNENGIELVLFAFASGEAMMASKGRVPMTTPAHPVGRRLWFVSLVFIVAIVAIGIIVSRDSQPHVGSPLAVRLMAAVIVTAFAAVAKIAAGPRAAAATALVGVLIAVVLLTRPA
jgi:hypothetical protein